MHGHVLQTTSKHLIYAFLVVDTPRPSTRRFCAVGGRWVKSQKPLHFDDIKSDADRTRGGRFVKTVRIIHLCKKNLQKLRNAAGSGHELSWPTRARAKDARARRVAVARRGGSSDHRVVIDIPND